jgi:hypothetical protein
MDKATIAEIAVEFLNEEGWKKTSPLDQERVRSWMHSPDLEVLGAVHRLLYFQEHLGRVTPPLSFEESFQFRKHYYERCLREYSAEDADEDDWNWADWGFNSAHGVTRWFCEMWEGKNVPRTVLIDIKEWLAELLKQRVQDGLLATAVCDHILSKKKLAKFFADWRNDSELCSILNW